VAFEAVTWDDPVARVPLLAGETPQDSVNRSRQRPATCDITVVILWSRMGTPLPRKFIKPDGKPYLSGTEWECLDALNSPFKPAVLIYRRTQEPKIGLRDPKRTEKTREFAKVERFFSQMAGRGVNGYETTTGFKELLGQHLLEVAGERVQSILAHAPESFRPSNLIDWKGSPFPGLRPFGSEDAPVFFGRGHETDGLIQRLADSNRFTIVVGASGSGKSSLVAAGLLPRLEGNAIAGSAQWLWIRFTPGELGDNPFLALAASLEPVVKRLSRTKPELARNLQEPAAITELCNVALAGRPKSAEFLLYIDQFEELFTAAKSDFVRPFIDLVLAAAHSPRMRVVATLRSDFYPRCVEVPAMTELLRAGSYPLASPRPEDLLQMIVKPADRAGLVFERGLQDRIVDDTGNEPGALPLMAFALSELYERRDPGGLLTRAAYESFGGVQGAIGRRAEETFRAQDERTQAAMSNVFRHLVEVDDRGVPTRRRAAIRLMEGAEAAKLTRVLTDARLLVRSGGAGADSVIEVAHEALFMAWPSLAEWVRDTGEDLRLLGQVRRAAAEWERQKRRQEFLWPDMRLMTVWTMIEKLQPELNETEQRFVRPFDPKMLAEEINERTTTHERRAYIGTT
jgi:hypothetical protein